MFRNIFRGLSVTREVNAMRISTLLLVGVSSLALAIVSRSIFPANHPLFANLLWTFLCLGPLAAALLFWLEIRNHQSGKNMNRRSDSETENAIFAAVRKNIRSDSDRKNVA